MTSAVVWCTSFVVCWSLQVYDSSVCHMAFFKDPDGNSLILHHRYAPYSDGSTP